MINMKYIINFLESLNVDRIISNLEFSTKNEQITVYKASTQYLFYFTKKPDIFRSNLCKEIINLTEDIAHLKLGFNNTLSHYLDLKFNDKSVESFIQSSQLDIPKEFISQFEEKLTSYNSLNYIYLTLKINSQYPQYNSNTKKIKI